MRICISGAGVAGPALAHWLLNYGHQPTLVEIAPHFRRGGYIVDFWGKGYDLAERMGVLPRLQERGYHVREVRIVDESGQKSGGFDTDLLTNALDGRFVSLPRGELASILYDTIENRAETMFDNSITSLTDVGGAVVVNFTRSPPREFDVLIGADGLHSNVRQLAFAYDTSPEVYLGYHVAAFETTGYRPRDELAYVSFSRPGRQIARFAMRDDRTVFMMIFASPHPIHSRATDAQREILRTTFGGMGWEADAILEALQDAQSFYFDRVSQIHLPRWSTGRVALLGDAAHCPSLLAGEGCALAIIDAYVLAGELARADGNHAIAFRNYESRLRNFIEAKQRAAKRFAGQFAPRTAFGIRARNWATRAMNIPGVANLFLGRALRDHVDLPNY